MLKSQLIKNIAKKQQELSAKDVALAVEEILEYLPAALAEGRRIELRNFGSFSPRLQPSRNTHNPKTGKRTVTGPKCKPHFKPGKELKALVNNSATDSL